MCFFPLFFLGGGGCALVNNDATSQVLMTPYSSSVYPKQEVVLEGPIPEWGSMIPKELGSRNDIFAYTIKYAVRLTGPIPTLYSETCL